MSKLTAFAAEVAKLEKRVEVRADSENQGEYHRLMSEHHGNMASFHYRSSNGPISPSEAAKHTEAEESHASARRAHDDAAFSGNSRDQKAAHDLTRKAHAASSSLYGHR